MHYIYNKQLKQIISQCIAVCFCMFFSFNLSHAETKIKPTDQHSSQLLRATQQADPVKIRNYLNKLIQPNVFRNYENIKELDRVAAYIKQQVEQFGVPCQYQTYQVEKQTYRNVVCKIETAHAKNIIVGAHYDVYGDFQGADDNASGVAGLIETARLLAVHKNKLKHNVELVFYTLEEPPFFRTEHMGSYIHAQSILNQKNQIQAVYILEMIGYFDHKYTQDYPVGLGLFYPKHGNFIAAVSNMSSRKLSENYCSAMKSLKQLDCQRLIAPSFIQGVDFSDHLNYWQLDIPAIMITDTAFFRNKHYHTEDDTLEKLDVNKMAQVIDGLNSTIFNF